MHLNVRDHRGKDQLHTLVMDAFIFENGELLGELDATYGYREQMLAYLKRFERAEKIASELGERIAYVERVIAWDQGKGVGTELMKRMHAELQLRGVEGVVLHAVPDSDKDEERLGRFYTRLGYARAGLETEEGPIYTARI